MRKNVVFSSQSTNIGYSFKSSTSRPMTLDNNHCHSHFEILYIVRGEGRYVVEGISYPIAPGSLMLIRPLEYHFVEIKSISESSPYERCVIRFSLESLTDEVREPLREFLENDGTSGKYYTPPDLSPAVISLIDRFNYASELPESQRGVYAKLLSSELILFLAACGGQKMKYNEAELGARVIKYLNDNLAKSISLDELSRRFCVSKYYLCREFKRHNGISVHGYINMKRIMYAKELIESGETASRAAYKVGFRDYSAFYRAYVKIIGTSPMDIKAKKALG